MFFAVLFSTTFGGIIVDGVHFRYRLSADVLRYALPEAKPSRNDEPQQQQQQQPKRSAKPSQNDEPQQQATVTAGGKVGEDDTRRRARVGTFRDGGGGGRAGTADDAAKFVSAVDGALPSAMLRHLQVCNVTPPMGCRAVFGRGVCTVRCLCFVLRPRFGSVGLCRTHICVLYYGSHDNVVHTNCF